MTAAILAGHGGFGIPAGALRDAKVPNLRAGRSVWGDVHLPAASRPMGVARRELWGVLHPVGPVARRDLTAWRTF